jgi:flagellar motor component MotA
LHKSLKDFKMRQKHQKNENLKKIEKLKQKVKQGGGGTLEDDEFDKIMKNPQKKGPGVFA